MYRVSGNLWSQIAGGVWIPARPSASAFTTLHNSSVPLMAFLFRTVADKNVTFQFPKRRRRVRACAHDPSARRTDDTYAKEQASPAAANISPGPGRALERVRVDLHPADTIASREPH